MNPQIAALVLHHIHNHPSGAAHWMAVAHGSEGQGPRMLLLVVVAIVLGTIIGAVQHAFSGK
jgi:hypothetical protein